MTEESYERERAKELLYAVDALWSATDHPEHGDIALYTDEELMTILGEWLHVRKACDALVDRIRAERPDLPGWDPIQKKRSVEDRLRDA
jgi:hypothetical protein